jgi:hypothetical protein
MLQWRIYYADGSTFDNLQGEPWDAPATRVLIIVQKDPEASNGAYVQWMTDYYLWKLGRWYAKDYGALLFYWFINIFPHQRACLAGETVDNNTWKEITTKAKTDPEFFLGN